MKKWIIVPIALIVVVLLAIYIVVPSKINLSQAVTINCTHGAANRFLINDSNWFKWWPLTKYSPPAFNSQTRKFPYKNYTFLPQQSMFDAIRINILASERIYNSKILLIPKHKDSVYLQWNVEYYTGSNPVTRIQRYLQSKALSHYTNEILVNLKLFLEKPVNVYGIDIKKNTIKDSLLISTKKVFTTEPSTQNIYSLINKLKTYIHQQGARETGYPMLNIQQTSSAKYETMVAIPIDKTVKAQDDMVLKNLVQGNILVTEVNGGVQTVSNAFAQMENYLTDHLYESPAIPFYSLITDRTAETDTTKWVTRISYPVF